jgi:hypothetical protein
MLIELSHRLLHRQGGAIVLGGCAALTCMELVMCVLQACRHCMHLASSTLRCCHPAVPRCMEEATVRTFQHVTATAHSAKHHNCAGDVNA